jgi:hypothetical protein
MRREILAALVCGCFLVLSSGTASAQCPCDRGGRQFTPVRNTVQAVREVKPVRTALFGRRVQAQSCSSAPAVQSGGTVIYSVGGPNCANGNCAVPQRK